jgi:hypothetical protein
MANLLQNRMDGRRPCFCTDQLQQQVPILHRREVPLKGSSHVIRYSFLADYSEAWKWLREGRVAGSEQSDKVRVLAEYRINEPRTHCFVSTCCQGSAASARITQTGGGLDPRHARERCRGQACVCAATQCCEGMAAFFRTVDRLGVDRLTETVRAADLCKSTDLMRRAMNL